jgi:large subunit ribosomal protein L43
MPALAKPLGVPSKAAAAIAPRTATRARPAPMRPVFRAQLASTGANGHTAFVPPLRKLVFEYDEAGAPSAHTRTFLLNHLEDLARKHPHVELVVRPRPQRQPIVRGFYGPSCSVFFHCRAVSDVCVVNDRDKVICLRNFETNGIQQKVQLLLDSSGAKIKSLKRRTVESSTEAARGIWSGMHVPESFRI